MAELTLDRMAAGGIHDQLGGGFHRYAVDAIWLVPHFEKMLYDNALLARALPAGLRGHRARRARRGRRVDARLPACASCGAPRRLRVGDRRRHGRRRGLDVRLDAGARCARCSATTRRWSRRSTTSPTEGNFEGATVLSRVLDARRGERALGRPGRAPARAARAHARGARRSARSPALDDKALASWNGMALAALAEGARVLERPDLLEAAEQLRRVPARAALAAGRHALAHAPRRPQLDPRLPRRPRAGRRGPLAAAPRDARSALARRVPPPRAAGRRPLRRPRRARAGATPRRTASSSSHGRARSTTLRRPRAPRRSRGCSCGSRGSTATTRWRRAREPSSPSAGALPARAPQAFGNLLCVASSLLGDAGHGGDRRPAPTIRPRARSDEPPWRRRARGDRLDRSRAAPARRGPPPPTSAGARTCLPPVVGRGADEPR